LPAEYCGSTLRSAKASPLGISGRAFFNALDTIHIPERRAETDPAFLLDFLEEFSFGMVFSAHDGLRASHAPTLLKRPSTIWWRLAQFNPQNEALAASPNVMVVFRGPHAYISPDWHQTKNAVPTWNFAVVHARGKVTRLDIESLEGKFKLGHERSAADREGALAGLERPQERDILALTRAYYARRNKQ
jgi:transcriptional regulator